MFQASDWAEVQTDWRSAHLCLKNIDFRRKPVWVQSDIPLWSETFRLSADLLLPVEHELPPDPHPCCCSNSSLIYLLTNWQGLFKQDSSSSCDFKNACTKLLNKGKNLLQREGWDQLEEIKCPTNTVESTADCHTQITAFEIKRHFSHLPKANKQNLGQIVPLIMDKHMLPFKIHMLCLLRIERSVRWDMPSIWKLYGISNIAICWWHSQHLQSAAELQILTQKKSGDYVTSFSA